VILLAVVLFFVFVLPLCFYTGRRVAIVKSRERRRRAFHRDQEIYELEVELGLRAREKTLEQRTMRQQLYVDPPHPPHPPHPPKPVPAWYEAYRDSYRSGYQQASESSDKLEVF
jgi:hypothetical protein